MKIILIVPTKEPQEIRLSRKVWAALERLSEDFDIDTEEMLQMIIMQRYSESRFTGALQIIGWNVLKPFAFSMKPLRHKRSNSNHQPPLRLQTVFELQAKG